MKAGVLVAALAAAVLCEPSAPCRCAPRTLAEYYADADEVVIGRLVDWTSPPNGTGTVTLAIELTAPPYKGSTGRMDQVGDTLLFGTAATTAECGVQPMADAVYVLFARRPTDEGDPTPAPGAPRQVDTCSGTRVHLGPDLDEPVGFEDVPARFVVRQLEALAGMDVIDRVVTAAPDAEDPGNETLVGLLDVSAFSHAGFATLLDEPRTGAPLVRRVEGYEELETRESGYEEPAAVVLARSAGWHRLRLADGATGWLPPDQAGTFFPYPDVVLNRLNYLPVPWHGFVWPSPGAGIPSRVTSEPGVREVPVEIVERMDVGGFPWLRVNVLRTSPCDGPEPRVLAGGWIPAWGTDGEPVAWYYSRGC